MASRTPIGGLLLEDIEEWSFHVQPDGGIAGQRRGDDGVLRIFVTPAEQLKPPVSHEQCLAIARTSADVADAAAFGRQMMDSVSGPFGSARFLRRRDDGSNDLVRIWYCNRPPGLIMGIYACSFEASRGPWYGLIGAQCAHMIGSAVFNRPAWGGDDELTRVLLTNLKDEEPYPKAHFPP